MHWFCFQAYSYLHRFLTPLILGSCWNRRCAHCTGVGHHSYLLRLMWGDATLLFATLGKWN